MVKIAIAIISLLSTLLCGCSGLQETKLFPFLQSDVTVTGNIIFCGGKPFAELKFFQPSEEMTDSQGLAMYYYNINKEIWIWPEGGIILKQGGEQYTKIDEMNRIWNSFSQEHKAYVKGLRPSPQQWPTRYINGKWPDKEDMVRSVSFAIKISDDGKYVYYKTQGMLFNSSRKYLVEYGLSK